MMLQYYSSLLERKMRQAIDALDERIFNEQDIVFFKAIHETEGRGYRDLAQQFLEKYFHARDRKIRELKDLI